MWIWPFRRVDSVVLVFCTKLGSNICYTHIVRSTHLCFWHSFYDIRLRLLVTWSSPHGRDASSHKIWRRYLYPIRSYWQFSEIKDGGRRHLEFVGGAMESPTKAHSWCVLPVKFRHDRLSSFQVIRIWIFYRSGLTVLFTPPKFQFLGVLPPKFMGTSFRPQKAHPCVISRLLSYCA